MSIKLDDKITQALQRPDTRAISVEMTPEKKEKYNRIAGLVVDLLRESCDGPMEAYMVLHFVQKSFEDYYGIRGGFALGEEKES